MFDYKTLCSLEYCGLSCVLLLVCWWRCQWRWRWVWARFRNRNAGSLLYLPLFSPKLKWCCCCCSCSARGCFGKSMRAINPLLPGIWGHKTLHYTTHTPHATAHTCVIDIWRDRVCGGAAHVNLASKSPLAQAKQNAGSCCCWCCCTSRHNNKHPRPVGWRWCGAAFVVGADCCGNRASRR